MRHRSNGVAAALQCAPPADVPAHAWATCSRMPFPTASLRQHPQDAKRYQLANGRMARLFDDSACIGEPWLVASELRFEAKDALLAARRAGRRGACGAISPRISTKATRCAGMRVDKRALVSERIARFDGIVLSSKPAGRVDPALAAQALTDAVRELGWTALPWSEALSQWRVRVQCLRAWMPELGLPDLSDAALLATLDAWLMPAFAGKTRLDALDESANWPKR
jgi:ATP-dependent helicase HrpB